MFQEAKREKIRFSESVDDNEDEIITFDSVFSSLLRGFLVEERKEGLYIPTFIRIHFYFRDCVVVTRKE
jgi:hypothetical protein